MVGIGSLASGAVVGVMAVVIGLCSIDSDHFRILPREDSLSIIGLFNQNSSSAASSQLHDMEHVVASYRDKQGTVAERDMKSQAEASHMVNNYYNLATDFFEYGWGSSFHFAHTWDNETHTESMRRHEQRVAIELGAKPDEYILDLGCGVGGPAREITDFSKATVLGITLNEYQVERAKAHTAKQVKAGMPERTSFRQMDFASLDLDADAFDHVYAIEATCHAHSLREVYAEAFRVLKPGGRFFTYEWLTTPHFDSNNQEHADIVRDIEYGNGLPPLRTIADALAAAEAAGFTVLKHEDLAVPAAGVRPWWYKMQTARTWAWLTHGVCFVTEMLGLGKEGTFSAHSVLLHAADGLVKGGSAQLFTPMHMVLMQKPY